MKIAQSQNKLNWVIFVLLIIILAVSIYSLIGVNTIKKAITPQKTLSIDEFLNVLTSHKELSDYKNINPLNIIMINNDNLATLQSQISGLDVSFIGHYLIQYPDRIIIYNMQEDLISANIPLQQLPPAGQQAQQSTSKTNKTAS